MIMLAFPLPKPEVQQAADQDDQQQLRAWGQDIPGTRPGWWLGCLLLEFDGGLGHRVLVLSPESWVLGFNSDAAFGRDINNAPKALLYCPRTQDPGPRTSFRPTSVIHLQDG